MPAPSLVLPDAPPKNWLDRFAPDWLKPYGRLARWDRPIGWWLLLWPCWWSAALAAIAGDRGAPNVWHLFLFLVGAIAMRGAGCTYNDLIDRDLDAQVERTRMRPLPSGQVTPLAGARLSGAAGAGRRAGALPVQPLHDRPRPRLARSSSPSIPSPSG